MEGSAVLLMLLIVGPILMAYGIYQVVLDLNVSPRKRISDRIKRRPGSVEALAALSKSPDDLLRSNNSVRGFLANAFSRLKFAEWLQRVLDQANVRMAAGQLMVNMTVAAAMILAVLVVMGIPLYYAVIPAFGGYALPILYFTHRRKKRLYKMMLQLPDVFEMLSQALRAGHSLASGMQLIASELPDPAGTEFARVFQEHNLGLKVEEALQNLAERMDVLDVRLFVTAVLIQRQTGGDLAEVMDKISRVIRDRIELFGTVKALTAEGRLSGYVLLALPVIVFIAMLKINPDYANVLVTDSIGQMLLVGAIVMMLMGWAMINKIVNIKV